MEDKPKVLPPLPAHLTDPARLAVYRSLLVKKMGEVNTALEKLLSNEKATLATLKLPGLGGGDQEDPIDKLRRYLALLKELVAHINKNDGQYGRCVHCGEGLGDVELEQLPWADTCRKCVGK